MDTEENKPTRFRFYQSLRDRNGYRMCADADLINNPAFLKEHGFNFATWVAVDTYLEDTKHQEGWDPVRFGDVPLDFDADDPDQSRLEAIRALDKLEEAYGFPAKGMKIYFTGKKGFHVRIPAVWFGLETGEKNLPLVYKRLIYQWAIDWSLRTLDRSIYDMATGQMLRIPHRLRQGPQTFEIEITVEELRTAPLLTILEWSRKNRTIATPEDPTLMPLNSAARDAAIRALIEVYAEQERYKAPREAGKGGLSQKFVDMKGDLPSCIEHILTELPDVKGGDTVNKINMNLVKFFQEQGYELPDALEIVENFLVNYQHSLSHDTEDSRTHDFVTKWRFYANNDKREPMGCAYMRGLHLPGSAFECSECPRDPRYNPENWITITNKYGTTRDYANHMRKSSLDRIWKLSLPPGILRGRRPR
jgi:hypothetical protein